MRLPLSPLGTVKGLGPEGVVDGFLGPFDKALAEELGATVAPIPPSGLATALRAVLIKDTDVHRSRM
jgi:hypothetical protein